MSFTVSELQVKIKAGKSFSLIGTLYNFAFYEKCEKLLKLILDHYQKIELYPGILAVLQELGKYSNEAILREVFYFQSGGNVDDEKHFETLEPIFQNILKRKGFSAEMAPEANGMNLYTKVNFFHSKDGIQIEVANNAPISKKIETAFRSYMTKAMQYDTIMDYYQDYPDQNDIGLALSVQILKEMGARPELLRVGFQEGTLSKLEIPFAADYQTYRDFILQDQIIYPFEKSEPIKKEQKIIPLKLKTCPLCKQSVDIRTFFSVAPADLIDINKIQNQNPFWKEDLGICAECVGFYLV